MKRIVIFSHGFGVRLDDRGLFTDIASSFDSDTTAIMFDYNKVDEAAKTLTVRPLKEQAEMFRAELPKAKQANPGADIYVIAHSQGCLVAAMADPEGVKKVIMLAPAKEFNVERLTANFSDRPGTVFNPGGVSQLERRDGTKTLVGPEYIKEINQVEPVPLYNHLAKKSKLVIFHATEDEVLGSVDYTGVDAEVVEIAADHNFTGPVLAELISGIRKELA